MESSATLPGNPLQEVLMLPWGYFLRSAPAARPAAWRDFHDHVPKYRPGPVKRPVIMETRARLLGNPLPEVAMVLVGYFVCGPLAAHVKAGRN
jgi:hypothetical protein